MIRLKYCEQPVVAARQCVYVFLLWLFKRSQEESTEKEGTKTGRKNRSRKLAQVVELALIGLKQPSVIPRWESIRLVNVVDKELSLVRNAFLDVIIAVIAVVIDIYY